MKTEKGKLAETEKQLAKDKHFAGIQRNHIYRPQQLQTGTNDPAFSQEWHLTAMHITKAWEYAVGQGQRIAIFDTGCSPVIADLKGQDKIGKGYDTLSVLYAMQNGAMMAPLDFGLSAYLATEAARNNNRGNPGDSNGHGTRVATVAAARADNRANTAGVAPNAIIEPVLVTDPMGCTGANDATIIEGLYFAKKNKIKIVNISWGNSFTNWAGHTLLWDEIRKYHDETGGLVFLSAGNNGSRDSNLANDYMVVVSGVDRSLQLSKSSNYGNSVYFTAPSEGILCSDQNGQTVMVDGTSFAAPIVAGVAALVWSANPGLTNKQVLAILKASCIKPEGAASNLNGWNEYYGYGMPDAEKAVKLATGRM
ncbi:MAG TPA: S8 family serine peptidase [Candidatus Obscuribacterales bacterium]